MKTGHRWTLWVARQLQGHGVHGRVPAMRIRSVFADRASFRDEGDIYAWGHVRVEVRSLAIGFRDVRSWPWPMVRVDLVGVIESKLKAALILFVSRTQRGIVGLRPNRKQLVLEASVYDRRRGVARDWMVTDRQHLMDFPQCIDFLHERRGDDGEGVDTGADGVPEVRG